MVAVSVLGVPNDENSSHLRGAAGAPGPIRKEFFSDAYSSWAETGADLSLPGRINDLGDLVFNGETDPWTHIEVEAGRAMDGGGRLICLGGDHAITHPIMRAVRARHPKLTILHIDAHADIYDDFLGNPRSHASPFARIMEEGLADRLIQVGIRTLNDHHRRQAERFGIEIIPMAQWRGDLKLDLATPVYISLDMDGLDPAFAPGVSHREPGGPSTRQVIDLIQSIDQPIIGADIVEYNPACDLGGMTATVAAKLMKEIAGMIVKTHGG